MELSREQVIYGVQELWDANNDKAATTMLADLELDDLAREETIVSRDLRLYREGQPTVVPDQRLVLAHYVSIHNRCQSMVTTVEKNGEASRFIRVVGFESDVATDRILYRSLVSEMLAELAGVDVEGLKRKQADEKQEEFCEQFAWAANLRLDSVKRAVEASAKKKGLAARLRDRTDLVKARYREMFPNLKVVPHLSRKEKG